MVLMMRLFGFGDGGIVVGIDVQQSYCTVWQRYGTCCTRVVIRYVECVPYVAVRTVGCFYRCFTVPYGTVLQ